MIYFKSKNVLFIKVPRSASTSCYFSFLTQSTWNDYILLPKKRNLFLSTLVYLIKRKAFRAPPLKFSSKDLLQKWKQRKSNEHAPIFILQDLKFFQKTFPFTMINVRNPYEHEYAHFNLMNFQKLKNLNLSKTQVLFTKHCNAKNNDYETFLRNGSVVDEYLPKNSFDHYWYYGKNGSPFEFNLYLKVESLHEGMKSAYKALGENYIPENLPHLTPKTGKKSKDNAGLKGPSQVKFSSQQIHTSETIDLIKNYRPYLIKKFDYQPPTI